MKRSNLIGHKSQQRALLKALSKHSLHHTLLFSGPEGIGKRVVARNLAETLFCQKLAERGEDRFNGELLEGCKECHHCKLIAAGNMPDLISINCEDKEEGSTDKIKEILKNLRLKPFSGSSRVIILDNAHALHGQSANALLKSLEEPRPGTYFTLITDKPHLMLKTIHSRSERWSFHPLSESELFEVLQGNYEGNVDRELISLSAGSAFYYRLLDENSEYVKELEGELRTIEGGDRSRALILGSMLAEKKQELSINITLLNLIARRELFRSSEEKSSFRWANFLDELSNVPHLILQRNFSPHYLFQNLLYALSSPTPEQYVTESRSAINSHLPS